MGEFLVSEFVIGVCLNQYEAIGKKPKVNSTCLSREEIKHSVVSAIGFLRESPGDTHTLSELGVALSGEVR